MEFHRCELQEKLTHAEEYRLALAESYEKLAARF